VDVLGSPDHFRIERTANGVLEATDNVPGALREGEKVAAIAYVDKDGANVAIVGKLPKVPGQAEWTVLGTRKWSGDWNVAAALRWSI
jgi:hypothetical protein